MDSKPKQVIPEKVIGYAPNKPVFDQQFTPKDAIIYALGIGYSKDPMNNDELRYTCELKDDFNVFPTIGCTFNDIKETFNCLQECPGMPNFNPMMLLHGEQHMEFLKPIKTDVKLISNAKCVDIADKKSGAFVTFEVTTDQIEEDGTKETIIKQYMAVFIRGIGGFGKQGTITFPMPQAPKTQPTKTMEEKTDQNQAIFYRLAGDTNPLHIDPDMASMGGFDRPILHGLCTYGICAKNIVNGLLGGDTTKLQKLSCRFTSHVFPGETMVINTWKDGAKIIYNATTKERGKVVITGVATVDTASL